MVLESQLLHKTVNLLFNIADWKLSWRVCGGINFLNPFHEYNVWDEKDWNRGPLEADTGLFSNAGVECRVQNLNEIRHISDA